jgi:uncharacterized membrane protein
MDNKKLGIALIAVSIAMIILLFVVRHTMVLAFESKIDRNIAEDGVCHIEGEEECPHEEQSKGQVPIFIAMALLVGIASLGTYLIFFEKSQKEILSVLRKQRKAALGEEKFRILLKGLDADERKVVKAVKEQDGITQQTLRLRTDLHKSKLSIVLDGLEKKALVKRVAKGKTKQVYLKIHL